MKSNFWEELNMSDKIMKDSVKDYHNASVENMNLPNWAKITCPDCKKEIEPSGIRTISCCLNARNIGDVSVEFNCNYCGIMNTVFYRKAVVGDIGDFADMVKNGRIMTSEPVVEEEMYKLRYNNLMENLIKEIKNDND